MVTSVVTNNADVGREAEFDVMLPVDAFITNLTMKLENETVVGTVNEKKKAKKIYDKVSSILLRDVCIMLMGIIGCTLLRIKYKGCFEETKITRAIETSVNLT